MNNLHSKFLILGLTGPIGSGCTKLATFLHRELTQHAEDAREQLKSIDELIGQYYRYLREMQNDVEDSEETYFNAKSNLSLKPEQLLSSVQQYEKKKKEMSEKNKRIINKRLKRLITRRDVLEVLTKTEWKNFEYISMSDMIVMLAMKYSIHPEDLFKNGDDVRPSEDFKKYKIDAKISETIADKIFETAKKYRTNIAKFEEKEISELAENPALYKQIDGMFSAIHEAKKEIYNIEEKDEEWLQDLGDNIRGTGNPFRPYEKKNKKYTNLDVLSKYVDYYISYTRKRTDKKQNDYFVIDSFRNPEEIHYFRKKYAPFYVCSIYADKSVRKERITKKYGKFSEKREKRDRGENNEPEALHKQNVSGCALISDYAITNSKDFEEVMYKLGRLLVLVERPGLIPPTEEEVFMNSAYALSLRSSCLSRQVGAIITNKAGFIIGAGWNDVGSGELGCATRNKADYIKHVTKDSILSVWDTQFAEFKDRNLLVEYHDNDYVCFKDVKSKAIIKSKIDDIRKSFFDEEKLSNEMRMQLENVFKKIEAEMNVKRLEYARSLHAEENAILQVATYGGMGIAGGTIYTTTFPCELCAKKIYQSGIEQIVYTEPYPQSISEEIFLKDGVRHIVIRQFEGVKSNSFYKLFKSPLDRKDMQKISCLYYE